MTEHMKAAERLTPAEARKQGFTVDADCYPWIGYKGDPLQPTARCHVWTDVEAQLLAEMSEKFGQPLAELAGSKPLVLYFPTDQDRDDFVTLVRAEKNMRSIAL